MDCLAGLERGYFYPSPAALVGKHADCLFCIARCLDGMMPVGKAMILNGPKSGNIIDIICAIDESSCQYEEDDVGGISLGMREHSLILPMYKLMPTSFLPNLSLRDCFIIDELAVWFCNASIHGVGFHWDENKIHMLTSIIWDKRIPISANEMSKVLSAHGLPGFRQIEFEKLFDFGLRAIRHASGRPAIKKKQKPNEAVNMIFQVWRDFSS